MNRAVPARATVRRALRGFSVTKLLVFLAIVAVALTIFYGGPKEALACVRAIPGELKTQMYLDEFRTKVAAYIYQRPAGLQLTFNDVLTRCGISEGCAEFLRSSDVRFIPFGNHDPDMTVILEVTHHNKGFPELIAYTRSWLYK
jgi:hypothetical protein